ncbi:MAG: hypothetical protein AMJ84_02395 [Acidithiobacillales bacterium SM23_46]|nr:MAG: hypothetical protein AMJ84_02395 [Acidithiobacillales bacterium SM23_46]
MLIKISTLLNALTGEYFRLYGGGKGDAPPAPDYRGAAQEQAEASKQAINTQTWANRPTLNTPWGQMNWNTQGVIDPSTGQPVTAWSGNLQLTPEQQAALDAQQRIQMGRSGAAEMLLGQATGAFQTPFDWENLPEMQSLESVGYDPTQARNRAEQAMYQRQVGMIEPGLTQSEEARRTRLANMGLSPEGGSTAWNRAQEQMASQRQKAYQDAALASIAGGGAEAQRELGLAQGAMQSGNQLRQQAIAEEAQRRGMSLNELNALLTGQQVQSPQMPSFAPAGAAQPANLLGAAQAQGNYGLGAAQMNQGNAPDIGSLVGGIGGFMMGGPMGAGIGSNLFKF